MNPHVTRILALLGVLAAAPAASQARYLPQADTLFYAKMAYAVSLPPVDTARFLKWTRQGVAKYPRHGFLLSKLAEAYSIAGPVDSSIAVTLRLVEVDSGAASRD